MAASLSGVFNLQVMTSTGAPAFNHRLYTYTNGTTAQKTAWTDAAGTVAHTYTSDGAGGQYIALNARGELPAPLFLTSGPYDLVLKDALGAAVWSRYAAGSIDADLANTADAARGDSLIGVKLGATGATARTQHAKNADSLFVTDFGGDPTGVSDSTSAVTNAIAAAASLKLPLHINGQFLYASQLTIPQNVALRGTGWTSAAAMGSRSHSCLIKNFNGIGVLFSGDDASTDGVQFDSTSAKTGDVVQVTGSRVRLLNGASTNGGACGVRIGATETGADTINANCGTLWNWISINNGSHGVWIDHTNTTTSGSYPLGNTDANAWNIGHLLLGSDTLPNGGDGLRVGNCIDCTFTNIVAQKNTGNGIRLTTSARGHKFFGYYCESNTGGGLLFDSGAHSNIAIGGHAVIGSQVTIDNDGSNYIAEPRVASAVNGTFHSGFKLLNAAAAGYADADFYADTLFINAARMRGSQPSGSRGRWTLQTKANGGALADRLIVDEAGVTIPMTTNGILINKSAVDTVTPGINIEGGALARVDLVNSGAALTTVLAFYNASGQVGAVSTSASTTIYATSSDYRLKGNVAPLDGAAALAAVMAWPIRSFSWNVDGSPDIGVIAHELQALKPSAVTGLKDAPDMQGVDYSRLVPELAAAVQYLAARIAAMDGLP